MEVFQQFQTLETFRSEDEDEDKISSARALFQQTRCGEDEISCKSRPLEDEFAGKSARAVKSCPRPRPRPGPRI